MVQRIPVNLGRKKKSIGAFSSASFPPGFYRSCACLCLLSQVLEEIRCYSLVHACFVPDFLFHNLMYESKLAYRW